jgi:hypothetical protein
MPLPVEGINGTRRESHSSSEGWCSPEPSPRGRKLCPAPVRGIAQLVGQACDVASTRDPWLIRE